MMILYACNFVYALISLGTATEVAVRLFFFIGEFHVFYGLIALSIGCVSALHYRTAWNAESG